MLGGGGEQLFPDHGEKAAAAGTAGAFEGRLQRQQQPQAKLELLEDAEAVREEWGALSKFATGFGKADTWWCDAAAPQWLCWGPIGGASQPPPTSQRESPARRW